MFERFWNHQVSSKSWNMLKPSHLKLPWNSNLKISLKHHSFSQVPAGEKSVLGFSCETLPAGFWTCPSVTACDGSVGWLENCGKEQQKTTCGACAAPLFWDANQTLNLPWCGVEMFILGVFWGAPIFGQNPHPFKGKILTPKRRSHTASKYGGQPSIFPTPSLTLVIKCYKLNPVLFLHVQSWYNHATSKSFSLQSPVDRPSFC